VGGVHDVINCTNFCENRSRGLRAGIPRKTAFPIESVHRPYNSVSTTVLHCDYWCCCCYKLRCYNCQIGPLQLITSSCQTRVPMMMMMMMMMMTMTENQTPRPRLPTVISVYLIAVFDMICAIRSEIVMVLSRNITCTGGVRFPASLLLSCWNEKPVFSRTASPFDDELSPAIKNRNVCSTKVKKMKLEITKIDSSV